MEVWFMWTHKKGSDQPRPMIWRDLIRAAIFLILSSRLGTVGRMAVSLNRISITSSTISHRAFIRLPHSLL